MTGGLRKCHNGELHNYYSSPDAAKVIKSRRMRWARHVARVEELKNVCSFSWKSGREGNTWET
jgi:hypothetical protein